MKTGEYAAAIEGVRFFLRKELEPVATVWEYQVTDGFNSDSARRVFAELPDGLEICCFDSTEKKEEAYCFIRRNGTRLMLRRGGHGWMTQPKEESLDRAVEILLASPLVKTPDPRFESFRVTKENKGKPNHGLESTGAPPAAGTPETHP